eukprot:4274792-Amphidinium_carterae.1
MYIYQSVSDVAPQAFRGVVDIVPSIAELQASLGGRQQVMLPQDFREMANERPTLQPRVACTHFDSASD